MTLVLNLQPDTLFEMSLAYKKIAPILNSINISTTKEEG